MNKLLIIGLAVLSALPSTIESKKVNKIVPKIEETYNKSENTVKEKVEMHNKTQNTVQNSYTTRMTSYWANDGYGTGDTTSSGLKTSDFQINENGWYTYQNKLVIATASTRLGYTEMRTYNLYDEVTLNIDGVDYDAIVLDRCGACQKHNRIDLFVSNGASARDVMIEVK